MKRAIVTAVLGGAALVAAWSMLAAGNPFATGTQRYAARDDITFEFPASWGHWDIFPPTTGLGSLVVIVGTQPWGPCPPIDINCHYAQRLGDGQISVEVSKGLYPADFCDVGATRSDLQGRGPGDPAATGRLGRVDGRPAIQTDYAVGRADYYGADEWREWTVAVPGSLREVFRISARYRGPGVDEFRTQLDELVASIRLNRAIVPNAGGGPVDCGDPFPPALP
ncbi:MAG: hypothetical protein L0227_17425 [Chloroflexi bacterium]|nr:hypothetical protein [Chloroflexota bacterium]